MIELIIAMAFVFYVSKALCKRFDKYTKTIFTIVKFI